MTRLLSLLLILLLPACATWQEKARAGFKVTFEITKGAEDVTNGYMHQKCLKLADACKAKWAQSPTSRPTAKEEACPEVAACMQTKELISSIAVSIYRVLSAGLLATELGDKNALPALAKQATELLTSLRDTAKKAGLWSP